MLKSVPSTILGTGNTALNKIGNKQTKTPEADIQMRRQTINKQINIHGVSDGHKCSQTGKAEFQVVLKLLIEWTGWASLRKVFEQRPVGAVGSSQVAVRKG